MFVHSQTGSNTGTSTVFPQLRNSTVGINSPRRMCVNLCICALCTWCCCYFAPESSLWDQLNTLALSVCLSVCLSATNRSNPYNKIHLDNTSDTNKRLFRSTWWTHCVKLILTNGLSIDQVWPICAQQKCEMKSHKISTFNGSFSVYMGKTSLFLPTGCRCSIWNCSACWKDTVKKQKQKYSNMYYFLFFFQVFYV